MEEHKIVSTVVVFGSARLMSREEAKKNLAEVEKKAAQNPDQPDVQKVLVRARRLVENSRYYEEAREFARLVSSACQLKSGICDSLWLPVGGRGSWKLPTGEPTKRAPNR